MKHTRLITICLLLLISSLSNAQQPSFVSDSLDSYIERGMKQWQIPGLAIAIVKNGKVVLSKGYGVRELGKDDKVDENTLLLLLPIQNYLPELLSPSSIMRKIIPE